MRDAQLAVAERAMKRARLAVAEGAIGEDR